ncbi:MAG: hypothetical protein LBE36_09280 [Flavobacteriaceae bacterium]|jgi:hypothetical protein|nr:hypothetical protein [Flavobacteriaceae bacterium]
MQSILKLLFCTVLYIPIFSLAQEKKPPILYIDVGGGYAKVFSEKGGLMSSAGLNYETNKNLFTVRYAHINELSFDLFMLSPFTPIPIVWSDTSIDEYGILYGRRYTEDNFSYSFSAGVSIYEHAEFLKDEQGKYYENSKNYFGVPFEFNVKWFKSTKKPYTIYGVIPVGKPTAFGNSIGFKLIGNISKHAYIGFGIVWGIGYHKEY